MTDIQAALYSLARQGVSTAQILEYLASTLPYNDPATIALETAAMYLTE